MTLQTATTPADVLRVVYALANGRSGFTTFEEVQRTIGKRVGLGTHMRTLVKNGLVRREQFMDEAEVRYAYVVTPRGAMEVQ